MERTEFKRNFLKEIILRLDFQGVFQPEMEKVILKAKELLKDKNFDKYEQKITTKIIGDQSENKETQNQIVYIFSSDYHDYVVRLSTSYIILSVRCASYSPFDDYSKIFLSLAEIYKSTIDFFTVKRLGIRKINQLLIEDKNDISKYFNQKYYDSSEDVQNYHHIIRERHEHLEGEYSRLNLVYSMALGKKDSKEMLQVVFDSDVYIDKTESIEDTIFNKSHLNDLNDTLFSAYVNILSDDFIKILTGEKDIPIGIEGVEENE